MFSSIRRNAVGATVFAGGIVAGLRMNHASSDHRPTGDALAEILCGVKSIKRDLGIDTCNKKKAKVDCIGNFPALTDKHKSLAAKYIKANPEVYANLCNAVTPMGFTFDQAIQCGMDAPHLGVGIVAGEAAAYETFKEIMDPVIEGWHGYKPSDSHTSDMDHNKLVMTEAQAAKFDKHVVSTRIRAGRSINGLALPPATDRKQRRKVESLLSSALANMGADLAGKYYPCSRSHLPTMFLLTVELVETGQMVVVSSTMPINHFWYGLMRKIT